MSFTEDILQDEQEILNIFLDDDSDSDSSGKGQKRKVYDDFSDSDLKPGRRRKKKKYQKQKKKRVKNKDMLLRPNYFVGIKVSNPEIHKVVRTVQEAIIGQEPALHSALIRIPTLHITLAVTHLPDPDHVARAADILDKCVCNHIAFFNKEPAHLHFCGLKTFGNSVLFAGIEEGTVLQKVQELAMDLEAAFKENNFHIPKKGFSPHLTIVKLSKDLRLRKKGISKICSSLYTDMCDIEFGSQIIQSVQLLSMNKPKDEHNFYYCSHQINFDVPTTESRDHSECCKKPLSKTPNILKLQKAVAAEKDAVKRRFHTLTLAGLSAAICNSDPESENNKLSLLKTLFIISATSVAIIALVRGLQATK